MKDVNEYFQPVQTVNLDKEQGPLPEGISMYLVHAGWRPILIQASKLWPVLLAKYHYQLVNPRGLGSAGQVYFYTGWELWFREGFKGAWTAKRVLAIVEKDGSLAALQAISEHFASSHGDEAGNGVTPAACLSV
ncbi:uncharacterized protein ARMOST_11773 [Armillaria ostoyae]|uniref:Uncharacterized protein n=1 Tax=Armillaria ostoyae TaxID=47428 RepID=A0A284RI33_ARMOS|nr:uncharacterized protein ARMOST_11773 [Armillaria ostoyae]